MNDRFSKETAQQRTYRAFETLIAGEDSSIDLAQAALLIASSEYPNLDMTACLAQLDAFAQRVRTLLSLPGVESMPHLPAEVEPLHVIDALNHVLFEEEKFCGDDKDYYNPQNSFLPTVLERRTGIPISLSLVYMEVGKRVGIQIDGVGLPLHFMLRYALPHEVIYIDAYAGGLLMDEQRCRDRVREITQHRKLNPHWFLPVTHRQMLVRMLGNLKNIYIETEEYARALTICDFLVLLIPHNANERKDRGLIHLQLKHYARAIKDLNTYLEFARNSDDRYEIRNYIKTARQMLAQLN